MFFRKVVKKGQKSFYFQLFFYLILHKISSQFLTLN
jgi:hypothetical protein